MAVIRIELIPEFYFGDDAVLLAADHEGMAALEQALSHAAEGKDARSLLKTSGTRHEFLIGGAAGKIEVTKGQVIWNLSAQKASEILDKLAVLKALSGPGHHYVDIDSPAQTLILSVNEYLDSAVFAADQE